MMSGEVDTSLTSNGEVRKFSFKEDLWDRYSAITGKLELAMKNIKELISFLEVESKCQLRLGKSMAKAALNAKKEPLGELMDPMEKLTRYSTTLGEKYLAVVNDIKEVLIKDLNNMHKEIENKLKASNKEEKRLRNEFNSANNHCISCKNKDNNAKRNYESLQIQLYKQDDLGGKKLQKLQKSVHNAEKESKKAEEDYRKAVEKQNQIREVYYRELGNLMQQLEELDKKRIFMVKAVLEKYKDLQTSISEVIIQGAEMMNKSFSVINAEKDIQEFIQKTKSNDVRPPPMQFEPYIVKIPEELSATRFSTAVKLEPVKIEKKEEPVQYDQQPQQNIAANNQKVIKQVRVLYKYEPKDGSGEELAINEGDIVNVYEMGDDGWWIGECNGKQGYFPSNFVEEISGTPTTISNPEVQSVEENDRKVIGTAVALYNYEPNDEGELALNEGDVITVYEMGEDGWWYGEINGQRGLFPSNYTELKQ